MASGIISFRLIQQCSMLKCITTLGLLDRHPPMPLHVKDRYNSVSRLMGIRSLSEPQGRSSREGLESWSVASKRVDNAEGGGSGEIGLWNRLKSTGYFVG